MTGTLHAEQRVTPDGSNLLTLRELFCAFPRGKGQVVRLKTVDITLDELARLANSRLTHYKSPQIRQIQSVVGIQTSEVGSRHKT